MQLDAILRIINFCSKGVLSLTPGFSQVTKMPSSSSISGFSRVIMVRLK